MEFELGDEKADKHTEKSPIALAHHRRQNILKTLSEQNAPLEISDLARLVVRKDEDLDRYDMERMLIVLYHVDVPYLEEAGLVRFGDEEKAVTLTGDALE